MSLPASNLQPSARPIVAMGDIVDRIGSELAELATAIHNLQVLISPLLHEAALTNPAHLHELQDIDRIYQKVGNLGEFLAALAMILPKHWVLDPSTASQVITLSALLARLGLTPEDNTPEHPAGDCDFF